MEQSYKSLIRMFAVVVIACCAALHAQTGVFKITSFPSGANVNIDGVDIGKTTPVTTGLAVGVHSVVVAIPNSGWNPDTRVVTIVAGNNDLSVTLLPILTAGPTGPKGDKGDKGDTGPQGLPGKQGVPGASGAPGPQGSNGDNGDSGATGATGAKGLAGDQGPQGPGGPQGPAALDAGFHGMQEFVNPANENVPSFTYAWTAPAGITHVLVEMWGGGGGNGNSVSFSAGYSRGIVNVTPGATYFVNVGGGGAGGTFFTDGLNGFDTSVNSQDGTRLIFAQGGGNEFISSGDLSAAISHSGFQASDLHAFGASFCPGPLGAQTGGGGDFDGGPGRPGYALFTW